MRSKQTFILRSFSLTGLFLLLQLGCWERQRSSAEEVVGVPSAPGHYTSAIDHGGLQRTYRIHIPPSFNKAKPAALVLALHGGGGQGKNMEQLTVGGFNRLSDREGFIVVYPDGIERHWNDGRTKVKYRAHREKIDDVGFLSALIDRLTAELNVDRRRVYVTGISNGAMMSFRIACDLPDKIAAIAPVAGAMPVEQTSMCTHSKPISVLFIGNTKDPCVPWDGGNIRFGFFTLGKVLSVPESVRYWVDHNQCASTPAVAWEADADPNDGTRVRRETHANGKEGSEVVLCAIEGGGHTWPGGYQYLGEWSIGKTCRDITACEAIWDFFKKHPMK